jgi:hypothetical protein
MAVFCIVNMCLNLGLFFTRVKETYGEQSVSNHFRKQTTIATTQSTNKAWSRRKQHATLTA